VLNFRSQNQSKNNHKSKMTGTLLRINPEKEIQFRGTKFDQTITERLTLENLTNTNVGFKVKTTALKAYLVRPSSDVIKPGEKKEVQIMLQKLSEVPANNTHRFLVQGLQTSLEVIDSRDTWQELSRTTAVEEHRLSVTFPDVNGREGHRPGGTGSSNDLKVKYEEIVKYTQRLTEQKELVTKEITTLKGQLAARGEGAGRSGYQLWHIVLCVMLAILAMKVFEKYQKEIMALTGVKM